MEYTTRKHPRHDFYVQKDQNGQPVAVYYFTLDKKMLTKITVLADLPQYFVLPQVPSVEKESVFDADYTLNCECLEELWADQPSLTFICTGNTIKMTGGQVPMRLVMATGQSLHAVTEKHSFNEPSSYILVAPTQEKKTTLKVGNFWYNKKYTSTRIDYGFKKLPQNTFSSTLKINRTVVFNPQTQEIESTPNYNEHKFHDVLPLPDEDENV